jgi:hypothetical protein
MRGKVPGIPNKRKTANTLKTDWTSLGLHPAMLKFAEIYKAGIEELRSIEAIRGLSRDRINEAKKALDEKISSRFTAELGPLLPPMKSDLAGTDVYYGVFSEALKSHSQPEELITAVAIGLKEFDAEQRFREPLQTITHQHLKGDLESTVKYLKLEQNHQSVRYGFGLPPVKGNIDHRIIMQTGLSLGMEKLTAVQLELFFNQFCPCGEEHDCDDLRKLRKRILQDARIARERMTPKYCGTNQQIP